MLDHLPLKLTSMVRCQINMIRLHWLDCSKVVQILRAAAERLADPLNYSNIDMGACATEGEIPAGESIAPLAEADDSGSELSWSEDPTRKAVKPKPLGKLCRDAWSPPVRPVRERTGHSVR